MAGDVGSIHEKAQFISRALEISDQNMKSKREHTNPTKRDSQILSAIVNPSQNLNADGAPALSAVPPLAPRSANPAMVDVSQLIPPPRPISSTGHSQNRRASVIMAVAQGSEPPSTKSRTTDALLQSFAEIQAQESDYRFDFDFHLFFKNKYCK